MFDLINILPFIIIVLHFLDKWYLSKAKLWQVYVLTIIGSSCTVVFNYTLWLVTEGQHNGVLIFPINSAWTIAMAAKGIIRLVKEHKANIIDAIPNSTIYSHAKKP